MSPRNVLQRLAALAAVAMMAACAHKASPPPLYMWESFPRQQYDTLLTSGGSGGDEIIQSMEAHAEKARAAGAALPPGFRAHLGMLKLASGDPAQARRLWEAEKEAFPESAPFMDRLLNRLGTPANKENPA